MHRSRTRMAVLAAFLVAWHGMLLSLPHVHTGERLQTDVARCTAATPGSAEFHFHGVLWEFPHHLCLACLVASTFATLASAWMPPGQPAAVPAPRIAARWPGSGCPVVLPQLRAPPSLL
jgi:hypothetical protein